MEAHQIKDPGELASALAADQFLLFKHSPICPFSRRAFMEYGAFVDAHAGIPNGWIDVIDQRDWARRVAAEVGVPHESPQAILIRQGSVMWHASHRAITQGALQSAIED